LWADTESRSPRRWRTVLKLKTLGSLSSTWPPLRPHPDEIADVVRCANGSRVGPHGPAAEPEIRSSCPGRRWREPGESPTPPPPRRGHCAPCEEEDSAAAQGKKPPERGEEDHRGREASVPRRAEVADAHPGATEATQSAPGRASSSSLWRTTGCRARYAATMARLAACGGRPEPGDMDLYWQARAPQLDAAFSRLQTMRRPGRTVRDASLKAQASPPIPPRSTPRRRRIPADGRLWLRCCTSRYRDENVIGQDKQEDAWTGAANS